MVTDADLEALEELARHAGRHWQVADHLLECRTCGSYQLQVLDVDGVPRTVVAASDVLDEDRERLVYLAAAANMAPLLAAEVRRLRSLLSRPDPQGDSADG